MKLSAMTVLTVITIGLSAFAEAEKNSAKDLIRSTCKKADSKELYSVTDTAACIASTVTLSIPATVTQMTSSEKKTIYSQGIPGAQSVIQAINNKDNNLAEIVATNQNFQNAYELYLTDPDVPNARETSLLIAANYIIDQGTK